MTAKRPTKKAPAEAGADIYHPCPNALRDEFRRAGLNENQAFVGSYWVASAARGIWFPKVSAPVAEQLRAIRDSLSKAIADLQELGEPWTEWLDEQVTARVSHAEAALSFVVRSHPGGHSERKHAKLLRELEGFFESESFPVAFGVDSLFVRIFALVCDMEPEVARRTIQRLRTKS